MPDFTKKHYEAVAEAISELKPDLPGFALTTFELKLANMFAADNPRFKRETFHRECAAKAVDNAS